MENKKYILSLPLNPCSYPLRDFPQKGKEKGKYLLGIFVKQFWIICILCVFFAGNIFAQEKLEENEYAPKGFDFFFNAGMYKGHKFNANYYRGEPDKLDKNYGDPDINYILNLST